MSSSQPPVRRRVRRSPSEWAVLIAKQAASGQIQKVFCAERGIALASFGAAKRRAADNAATDDDGTQFEGAPDDFVPISLTALSGAGADDERVRSSAHCWRVELSLPDGITLRLSRG